MTLEIFDTGRLKIIGLMKHEGKENYILEYPGMLSIIPDKNNGLKATIVPIVVPFIENHNDLLKKFMLPRSMVLYHGPAKKDFDAAYAKYRSDLVKSVSGIEIAPAGMMNKLPKFMGGRR